jgi:hypothetical protein
MTVARGPLIHCCKFRSGLFICSRGALDSFPGHETKRKEEIPMKREREQDSYSRGVRSLASFSALSLESQVRKSMKFLGGDGLGVRRNRGLTKQPRTWRSGAQLPLHACPSSPHLC